MRARITGGEFSPGAPLPPETSLAAEHGVARNTMRRALEQLTAERLIATCPGRGRIVLALNKAHDATPRYRRIAADLQAMIETGAIQRGDMLPSEAVLAARYGAARGAVRQALAELDGAGLIESVHGKGRFVLRR